jgi:hypothetical protein
MSAATLMVIFLAVSLVFALSYGAYELTKD